MYKSPRTQEQAKEWVKIMFKPESISPLAGGVINLIEKVWGIHNFGNCNLAKTDWTNSHQIVIRRDKSPSTVDSSELTELVVFSHELMLRMEIKGRAKGYLDLIFHKRESRDIKDGFDVWCPDIKQHVSKILREASE